MSPSGILRTGKEAHNMRLKDKAAIINGGSRGIGRGVAVAFANEGAFVAIVGRNKTVCDETASFITKNGGLPSQYPQMCLKKQTLPIWLR